MTEEDKNFLAFFEKKCIDPTEAKILPEELDYGDTEYKLQLVQVSPERFVHLKTQMNFRLNEGCSHCVYHIGYQDGGFPQGISKEYLYETLETLRELASLNQAKLVSFEVFLGSEGLVATVNVMRLALPGRNSLDAAEIIAPGTSPMDCRAESLLPAELNDLQCHPLDLRIALAGDSQSGKSTLIGVLTRGTLDNGRGLARMQVFQHNHEVETGATSSISHQAMCLDSEGKIMNRETCGGEYDERELFGQSAKVVTFMDLAGAPKYLKTTVFGLVAQKPDYVLLCVAAGQGLHRMTREHLGITLALKVPLLMIITKCDCVPNEKINETVEMLKKIISSPAVGKKAVVVKSEKDVNFSEHSFGQVVPIFQVSCVSGQSLNILRRCVTTLPASRTWSSARTEPLEFHVEDYFQVSGVGTVYAGTIHRGCLRVGQELLLGPDRRGHFCPAIVKSVHNAQRTSVIQAHAGQSAAVALVLNKPDQSKFKICRKGLVLVEPALLPSGTFEFDAEVLLLHHPRGVARDYQAVIHANSVRQTAKITAIQNKERLKSGDRAICRFRFLYHPEYISPGSTILFRDGFTRGIGKIISIHG